MSYNLNQVLILHNNQCHRGTSNTIAAHRYHQVVTQLFADSAQAQWRITELPGQGTT